MSTPDFLECHTHYGTRVHLLGPGTLPDMCTCRIPSLQKANKSDFVIMSLHLRELRPTEKVQEFLARHATQPSSEAQKQNSP